MKELKKVLASANKSTLLMTKKIRKAIEEYLVNSEVSNPAIVIAILETEKHHFLNQLIKAEKVIQGFKYEKKEKADYIG